MDKEHALRVVVDDYKDRPYILGLNDCATLCADYAGLLGFEHDWDRNSKRDSKDAIRVIFKILGRNQLSELEPRYQLGDINLIKTENNNFCLGLRLGTGIITMVERSEVNGVFGEGLFLYEPDTPIKAAWRI